MIFVDADACPVKSEVLKIADRAGAVVTLVANSGLRPSRDPMVVHQLVPQGPDVADDWIVEHCGTGDIVVTADIELAKRALEQGAMVVGPTGDEFTPESIGMAMAMRDLKRELRESGEISDHGRPFIKSDRTSFSNKFAQLVQKAKRFSSRDGLRDNSRDSVAE